MAQGRPYQAYQKTGVQTSNQKQLIVMLYDGMDRFMNKAVKSIEEGDLEVAHENLHRTGKILLELTSTLRVDKGGDVAANLKRIYVYCYEQVVMANLRKDVKKIREVQQVLANLAAGWKGLQTKASVRPMQRQAYGSKIRVTG